MNDETFGQTKQDSGTIRKDDMAWRAVANTLVTLTGLDEPHAVMALACRAACSLIGANGASFILRDGPFFHHAERSGIAPAWQGVRFAPDEAPAGKVLAEGAPCFIPDSHADENATLYRPAGIGSLMIIPLPAQAMEAADAMRARPSAVSGMGTPPGSASVNRSAGGIEIYWAQKHEPQADEIHVVELLAATAAKALARYAEASRLGDNETKLQLVLKTGRFGAFELDTATKALDASPICKDHYGRDPRLPFTFADMISTIHPLDRPDVIAAFNAALTSGVAIDRDYRLVTVDGELRRLHVHAQPVRNREGRCSRLVGASLDITAWDKAATIVRASERRMQLAEDAALVGTWEWDVAAREFFCSAEQNRLFGRDPVMRTVSEDDFFAPVHEGDRDALKAAIISMTESGGFECEYRLVTPQNEIRWIVGRGRVLADPASSRKRCIGIMMDVTERHRTEEVLRASEDRYRTLSESLPLLVWATRPDGYCTYVSPQWLAYTGRPEKDQLGNHWMGCLHPDDLEKTDRQWTDALQSHQPYDVEYRLRRYDGVYRWFKTRGMPVRDASGTIIYWLGTCTDIHDLIVAREVIARHEQELERLVAERTAELAAANIQVKEEIDERSKVQAQLAQAQRIEAIGQVTSGIAHDFNNLLTVILGNLDLLDTSMREPKSCDPAGVSPMTCDPKILRRLSNMRLAGERGAKLTSQLLAFSRRQRLQPKPIDLNETIFAVRELLQGALGGAVSVDWRPGDNLWAALADSSQIELVLLNLAINARDAMPDGGTLTITTGNIVLPQKATRQMGEPVNAGDYVTLSVADIGCGMSEAVKARVFEPFFTTKPIGKGSGLGLPQVYGFATQSGGGVAIDTEEGIGTTVTVYLPRAEPLAADADETSAQKTIGKDQDHASTILLVDDDSAVREITAHVLIELGYKVVEAGSGATALACLDKTAEIDLLLVDFAMPGMNGVEVASAVRERLPDLPILFITGYADLTAIKEVAEERIIQKPFDRQGLAHKVMNALKHLDTGASPSAFSLDG